MSIVVLGGGINKKGNLFPDSQKRVEEASRVYKENPRKVLLCGKYSFFYEGKDTPLKTEAEAMRDYILKLGVKEEDVFLEKKSQDTVFNAYYAKTEYFIPHNESEALIVTSDFSLERAEYIFSKVFGENYDLHFLGVPSSFPCKIKGEIMEKQKKLTREAVELFQEIEEGDHEAVREKIISTGYYEKKKEMNQRGSIFKKRPFSC